MARRNETLPREVRAVLMQEWIERQRPAILAKLPTQDASGGTPYVSHAEEDRAPSSTESVVEGARYATSQSPASFDAIVPELGTGPGEVVHPGALAGVVPSGARVNQAPRSGVQPTCHSPEITEEEKLSRKGFATPADLSKKNGRRRAHNKSTAKEHVNHV
jgi:hypothetical protein